MHLALAKCDHISVAQALDWPPTNAVAIGVVPVDGPCANLVPGQEFVLSGRRPSPRRRNLDRARACDSSHGRFHIPILVECVSPDVSPDWAQPHGKQRVVASTGAKRRGDRLWPPTAEWIRTSKWCFRICVRWGLRRCKPPCHYGSPAGQTIFESQGGHGKLWLDAGPSPAQAGKWQLGKPGACGELVVISTTICTGLF